MLASLTVMWGSAFGLTKVAVGGLAPTAVVAGRLSVACLVLLVAAAFIAARKAREPRPWIFWITLAFFGNALPFSLISWGQAYIDSGLAGILMAVMPLVTLGLAHYLIPGESMTRYRVGGFLLGFAGIAVLTGPDALLRLAAGEGQLLPMMAILGGASSYAVAIVLARLRPPSSAVSTATATTFIATALMLPLLVRNAGLNGVMAANASAIVAVILLGVFSTATASVVYFRLVKTAGPGFVSQINYLIPLWAVAIGVVFMGEELEVNHVYALALVLGGIFVAQLESRRLPFAWSRTHDNAV
ncbi:MAG: DMT family transporter [Gammaproteobacteria bacterium]|nr:DMT family transporter [Gammaproteobacteria bacterium]